MNYQTTTASMEEYKQTLTETLKRYETSEAEVKTIEGEMNANEEKKTSQMSSIDEIKTFFNETKVVKPVGKGKSEELTLHSVLQSLNMDIIPKPYFKQPDHFEQTFNYFNTLDSFYTEYKYNLTDRPFRASTSKYGPDYVINVDRSRLKNLDIKFGKLKKFITDHYQSLLEKTAGKFKDKTGSTNANGSNIRELFKTYYETIDEEKKKLNCDITKLDTIVEQCIMRKYEGYMINRSIRDLITDVKSIMRYRLIQQDKKSKTAYMPLCFETQIDKQCLVPLKDQEIYDTFYDIPEITDKKISSKILKTISLGDVDLRDLNFVVFTVLNVSASTNNPPNPPFININELILHRKIVENTKKTETAYKAVLEKLKKYKFYYSKSTNKYISHIETITYQHSPVSRANDLIEFINNVNQTTLIGTLESSDKLKHYIFNSIPCLITEITPTTPVGGGKRQFIEDRNHMIDQNRRHVSTRRKQLKGSKGSKLTRKSKKDYRYS